MTDRCRVVLVDDHAVVRAGIKLLIELTKRYEVVGEAENGEAAVERVSALQPDLVVMDIRMPGLDGIAATRRITNRNPDVRVLVFTAYDDPEYVEAVIEAGAMGCLSKRRARSDLVAALDMLASGRMTFPAHVTGLLSKRRSGGRRRDDVAALGRRERETLFLTAAGYTAEEIAARGVSTLEEFFRTLPWTYPSITTQTNTSLHFDGTDQDDEYIELGLGISTVNLRNMGSANTLVLMNGRRIAGTGEEDDFANILNVPLSAIERVDIQLDGASAVYGSDAIGGVVNFITKKNYTGLSVDYRHEFSSTDADQTTASLIGGHA